MGVFDSVKKIVKRNTESIEVFNDGGSGGAADGAIRSATTVTYEMVAGIEQGRNLAIFIRNGLDQAVRVQFRTRDTTSQAAGFDFYDKNTLATVSNLLLVAEAQHASAFASIEVVPMLGDTIFGSSSQIFVTTTVAPASGFVSMVIYYEE